MQKNIFPDYKHIVLRSEKERNLQQTSTVFWFTGLSGSGKSTLAKALERELYKLNFKTNLLDGDNLRAGINNNLGFSHDDRLENIRRTAEVAKLFLNSGIITLVSLISPTLEIRSLAKDIIGEKDFHEIYVNCSFECCAERDTKGLYAKAAAGEIKNFTGLDAPYEAPKNPFLEINTQKETIAQSLAKLLEAVLPLVK